LKFGGLVYKRCTQYHKFVTTTTTTTSANSVPRGQGFFI
jgi:hypothetical protein